MFTFRSTKRIYQFYHCFPLSGGLYGFFGHQRYLHVSIFPAHQRFLRIVVEPLHFSLWPCYFAFVCQLRCSQRCWFQCWPCCTLMTSPLLNTETASCWGNSDRGLSQIPFLWLLYRSSSGSWTLKTCCWNHLITWRILAWFWTHPRPECFKIQTLWSLIQTLQFKSHMILLLLHDSLGTDGSVEAVLFPNFTPDLHMFYQCAKISIVCAQAN